MRWVIIVYTVGRVYESLQAVTLLSLSGLEIPALSFLRDIVVEIEHLLNYFIIEPQKEITL
jgi:hypothetical protein